jgi:sensor histidine kinase YesM
MIIHIIRLYKKHIGSRFIIKLFLCYATIILVLFGITTNIISSQLFTKIYRGEIILQKKLLNDIKDYTNSKIDNISDMSLSIYQNIDGRQVIIDNLRSLDSNKPVNMGIQGDEVIKSLLSGIPKTDKDILDSIILNRDNRLFSYTTSSQARSVILGYDFSSNKIIKDLGEGDYKHDFFADSETQYILGQKIPVITFAGIIADASTNPYGDVVGKYIINLSTQCFADAYTRFSGNPQGNIIIISDAQQRILFSRQTSEIGSVYPYFKEILESKTDEIQLDKQIYIVNHITIIPENITIISTIPKESILKEALVIKNQVILTVMICLLLTLLITLIASKVFEARIKGIENSMRQVEDGNFNVGIIPGSDDELGHLSRIFNTMCQKLNDYIERVYIAEIKTKNAEIHALQSKINPHFLFNTIETIRMKSLEYDMDDIADMLEILGRLFRWNVKDKGVIVSLEEEINYVSIYLKLQQIRFEQKITINYDLQKGTLGLGIPKFLIQPIVENALYHGLAPKEDKCILTVKAYMEEGNLFVDIIDNGIGIDADTLKRLTQNINLSSQAEDDYYIGMSNVHQRIRLFFGREYGLRIASEKNIYTKVSAVMPAMDRKDMENYVQAFDRR